MDFTEHKWSGQYVMEFIGAKVSLYAGFFSEFIGTAVLLIMIFALLEEKNSLKPPMPAFPYILGAVVFAVAGLKAPLSVTSLNGARDIGPRILKIIDEITKRAAGKVLRRNLRQT